MNKILSWASFIETKNVYFRIVREWFGYFLELELGIIAGKNHDNLAEVFFE